MIVMTMTVAILNMRRFGEGLMDKLDTPAFEDNYNSYAFEAPTQLNSLDPRQNYRLSPQQQKRSQHSSGRR